MTTAVVISPGVPRTAELSTEGLYPKQDRVPGGRGLSGIYSHGCRSEALALVISVL